MYKYEASKLESQEKLAKLRNQFLHIIRSKSKGSLLFKEEGIKSISISDQDLLKSIISEFEYLISLSDYKIDSTNECIFLVEYNIKKLNEIIESYEETCKLQKNSQIDSSKPLKISLDKLDDNSFFSGKTKFLFEENEKQDNFLNRKKSTNYLT
jgi:hypothetical protein